MSITNISIRYWSAKSYLAQLQNIHIQITKYTYLDSKIYISRLQNIHIQITKYTYLDYKIYISRDIAQYTPFNGYHRSTGSNYKCIEYFPQTIEPIGVNDDMPNCTGSCMLNNHKKWNNYRPDSLGDNYIRSRQDSGEQVFKTVQQKDKHISNKALWYLSTHLYP